MRQEPGAGKAPAKEIEVAGGRAVLLVVEVADFASVEPGIAAAFQWGGGRRGSS